MDRQSLIKALRDTAQSASNTVAGNVSGPVDLLAMGLRKIGLPIPSDPVGGAEWMARQGLTREVEDGIPKVAGETLGVLAPMMMVEKAPQIAAGINRMASNAMAPKTLNKEAGALYAGGPRQDALTIAQRNAAKPVSEGGLGLPANNTPMDRAKALGFDIDYEMMHGAANDIKAFDPNKFGATTHAKSAEMGVFTTDNANQANFYAAAAARRPVFEKGLMEMSNGNKWKKIANDLGLDHSMSKSERLDALRRSAVASRVDPMSEASVASQMMRNGVTPEPVGGEVVYPLYTRYSNPLVDDFERQVRKHGNLPAALGSAKKQGYDHVVFQDVTEGNHNALWDIHFKPENIRSRFAAFDPARVHENDLLGRAEPGFLGLLGIGTGGGIAAYNYSKEPR